MHSWRVQKLSSCLTLALVGSILFSCGGGGGNSPTAPPPPAYPNVAGSWVGTWQASPILPVAVQLDLTQGASGSLTGAFTALGFSIPIAGSASTALSVTWHGTGNSTGCTQLNGSGQADAVAASRLPGTIDLDGSTCVPPGSRFVGSVNFVRTSAAARPQPRGSLADLVARLEGKTR
jgi:hypothetical protein